MLNLRTFALATLAIISTIFAGSSNAEELTRTAGTGPGPFVVTDEWVAYAVSPTGRVFRKIAAFEADAKNAALAECRATTIRDCKAAIAVFPKSFVVAVNCTTGISRESFIGGSNIDLGAAEWIAYDKARKAGFENYECSPVYQR